jgi:signal transduction histidine kinase
LDFNFISKIDKRATFQIILLFLMSAFWIPFLFSVWAYSNESWFYYLLTCRWTFFLLPILASIFIFFRKKEIPFLEQNYYIIAMLAQASHGILESANSIDFYSYTSLFLLFFALTYKGSHRQFLFLYLPVIVAAHLVPLFFKGIIFFGTISNFVDKFSFNISLILLSLINIRISINRNTLYLQLIEEQGTRLNLVERELNIAKEELIKRTRSLTLVEIAAQVAHDIRSPLEVLKGIKMDMVSMTKESRLRLKTSINRIEEITHNLLKSHQDSMTSALEQGLQSEELLNLLESIILEKKFEYSLRPEVDITSDFGSGSYGLFSQLPRGGLKRIISNLINNSLEALAGRPGVVTIKLYSEDEWNIIEVADNGSGIPEHIRDRLFTRGFTSKEMGNGLGLYGALKEINSLGGKMTFDSELGKGTVFKIAFLKSIPPSNFIKSIDAFKYEKIIISDDDRSFHQVWKSKLEPRVESFYSVKEILDKYDELPSDTLLISDFELMDNNYNGIDIILKYQNLSNCILATARSEERAIQEKCHREGIKILSKSVINYVPVNYNAVPVILVDDDSLICLDWQMYFEKWKIPFKSFSSIDGFLEASLDIDKASRVYVDSSLGNGICGEVEAEKIHLLGFQNIFLATGYQKEDIQKPMWIKEIYSKNPRNL